MLDAVHQRPGLAWLRNLELRSFDADVARLGPRSGLREAANFATRNRETIERLLGQITGRRIRVEIDSVAGVSNEPDTPPDTAVVHRSLTRDERDAAMNLPTVKELQQLFDVTLIDARPDAPDPA